MCTEKQWKLCNTSAAYHAATKFALTLEEQARLEGFKPKTIRIRNKEQITRGGFGKSDAQVIWEEGPEGWADCIEVAASLDTDYIIEGNTVSFYTR
jgi:hypothetical protein